MVTKEPQTPAPEETPRPDGEPSRQNQEAPRLSADYFSKLVRQPECVTKGVCNGCGRCEH